MDLSSYKGKKNVVLYFYPRDGTPGCTIQAIGFSDRENEFKKLEKRKLYLLHPLFLLEMLV